MRLFARVCSMREKLVWIQLIDSNYHWRRIGFISIPPHINLPVTLDVVEIEYQYANQDNSLVNPVYIKRREAITESRCKLNQLVYTKEA